MTGRALTALVALAALVVMGIWLQGSRSQLRATAIAYDPPVFGPRAKLGFDDARKARRLAPDGPAKLVESRLLFQVGRSEAYERLLGELLAEEPANLEAWVLLAQTTRTPERARSARRHALALDPLLLRRR
jgi:hypothetical protein